MKKYYYVFLMAAFLNGCASNSEQAKESKVYEVNSSYLKRQSESEDLTEEVSNAPSNDGDKKQFSRLKPIDTVDQDDKQRERMSQRFSTSKKVKLAADKMPINEFLHYVFGELLHANYVLSEDLKTNSKPLTLNIQEPITERRLFALVTELLSKNQISIDYNEDVFFIQKSQLGKAKAVIGIGSSVESVPATSGQILQVIPIKYGIKVSLERTIRELIDSSIRADFEQSAIFVLGDRANAMRAIELVNMLDVPANRGKHIALVSLTYIAVEDFVTQASVLLNNEGLPVGLNDQPNRSVSFVPLSNLGAVAIFANTEDILERVRYWVNVLDKPATGDSQQYFVYNPKYARATDLGESIGQLLSLGSRRNVPRSDKSTGSAASQLKLEDSEAATGKVVSGSKVSFVVDERSNSIIFSTTGSEYQILYPLLEKLDVLPKQVILEILIAEVSLSGDFKYGVEFALNQDSNFSISSLGSFGAGGGGTASTGGINLSYFNGDSQLKASFFKQNKYINVLSNPSLLVRDGVEANIQVGTDIPIQGGTVSDDGVTQTKNEYRTTGVDISVTPTINAQGVVIMNIVQKISNQIDDSVGANGNPSIFERSLKTEAVAASGQTVILGGLISENSNNAETKVPFFGDIPLIGNLFKGKNDSTTKTELVMLVTPKVIYSGDQWDKLINDFQSGLKNIRIVE